MNDESRSTRNYYIIKGHYALQTMNNQSLSHGDNQTREHVIDLIRSMQSNDQLTRQAARELLILLNEDANTNLETTEFLYQSPVIGLSGPTRFISHRSVLFHVVVSAYPLPDDTGVFLVAHCPRAPDGRMCLLECGHTIVIAPDFTTPWYLKSYEMDQGFIDYTAESEKLQAHRCIRVVLEWLSVMCIFSFVISLTSL